MTSDVMRMVVEFHEKYGLPTQAMPDASAEVVPWDLRLLRMRLANEENGELYAAVLDRDVVKIADGLADIVYVAYGTALTYGIDLDAVLAEVHRSNLTKEPPEVPGGKARKGAGYESPDVGRVLREQAALYDE